MNTGTRLKNPPPPRALAAVREVLETSEITPVVRVFNDGILLQFDELTEMLLMTARGARQLGAQLIQNAGKLEAAQGRVREGIAFSRRAVVKAARA